MSDFEQNLARAEKAVALHCPNCGTANQIDSRYCRGCGQALELLAGEQEAVPAAPPKPAKTEASVKPTPKVAPKPSGKVTPKVAPKPTPAPSPKAAAETDIVPTLVKGGLIVVGGILLYNLIQPLIGLAIFVGVVWLGIEIFRRLNSPSKKK